MIADREQVNHPNHYNIPGKRECIVAMKEDYGDHLTAVFCLMNSYKYLYRAGQKDGNSKDQDIAKARWYYNYVRDNLDTDEEDACFSTLHHDVTGMLRDLTTNKED